MKILYILERYPQLSETYIKSEIDAIKNDFEIRIISVTKSDLHETEYLPYKHLSDLTLIINEIREFKPDLIHSHYTTMIESISELSKKLDIPFTIRTHSFDTMLNGQNNSVPDHIKELHQHVNHELCKGLLIMSFSHEFLLKEGKVNNNKIVIVPPVINVNKFYNKESNGDGIMNVGAVLPKKEMINFVMLSKLLPEKDFNLYGVGYNIEKLKKFNTDVNGRVNFIDPLTHSKMPMEYKKNNWLVYTASKEINLVGLPISIMEAMASGTIVCMQNIRPDIKDFIGESGYLFDHVNELPDLLRQPINQEKREFAFEHCKQFDISKSIHKLTDLWTNNN